MNPLFTIITVTYNAATTIERTIRSVEAQTCTLYEHIIMDGDSTDHTVELADTIANERVDIVVQKDTGIYDAMNHALSRAKGDYVMFLNAGDTLHSPDVLQRLADAIMENDYPGIVYGQTDIVDETGRKIGERHLIAPERLTLDSFEDGMVVCHQSMAVLRRIVPYYNLKYRYSSDFEWAIICLQHSRQNVYVPMVVTDYLSEGMTTANHRASLRERFKIMCTYYGVLPTIWRHARFALRYLRRRRKSANCQ